MFPNLKEILIRNGFPEHFIDRKFFDFLCDPEKPTKPEIFFTLSLNYTSSQVEYYAKELVNRMKSFIPDFHVRYAFKSIKITTLFVKKSKPQLSKLDTCNLIYHFLCPCKQSYVGRTKRVLRIRAQEHRTLSRAKKLTIIFIGALYMLKNSTNMKKFISHQKLDLIAAQKLETNFLWTILKYYKKTLKSTQTFVKPRRISFEYTDPR